ncbi:hypothetical protein [Hyunsoonleella ulvae]|uniref:hypothetical protein n=1 Tax=Hyunsoonleella ulvae TaxID=2799948 RepID=UPI00193A384F|nr:hypothetical protein [Hyunsoonleella ulvae]
MKYTLNIKWFHVIAVIMLSLITISCEENVEAFVSAATDSDGDGIINSLDESPDDPCLPAQQMAYIGFDVFNETWQNADCDGDGVSNADEFEDQSRNPYLDENTIDTDGDGVADFIDEEPENPCVPAQEEGYIGFNSDNTIWGTADCDGDLIANIDEFINGTDPYKACNLNFDLSNYVRELRTVDSNNGEGVTIGRLGVECGEYIFTGGGIFNQGCFNDDVEILFVFTPNSPESSEGTITVPSTTYSCLSEDGSETREFTVEGTGIYQGELTRAELNYTMITPDGTETGTLNIRRLDDPGDDNGGDCNLDFDFSNFEGELLARDSNNGENIIISSLLESCNEISISGDFLNLGCTNNDIEFLMFLEPFVEGGNEGNAIVENATFSCTNEGGETIDYTFNASGFFSGNDGFMEFFGYELIGGGETITGNLFIEQSGDTGGGDDRDRCSFEGEYNSIVNIDGNESFGIGIFSQNPDNCNEYILSGDFLGLGCNNDLVQLGVFFGEEEGGSEVIISEATFTCEISGDSAEYTFRGFGGYSNAEGFIELSEFTLTDPDGIQTNGTIFFEPL